MRCQRVSLGGCCGLMVRAPAGHTGASFWRTSEPPHSSTRTLPTQITHFNILPLLSLSLSLAHFEALSKAIFLSNFNFSEHLFMQFSSNALSENPKIACTIVKYHRANNHKMFFTKQSEVSV